MEGSGTGREKLSLRRRLLAKKSPRVGCSMDADSTTSSSGDLQDARTLPEFLFVTKRSHENGDRACLSDSEAGPSFVTSTPQRLTNSSSAFIASSSFENKPSIRPKSMIENHSHINEDRNSYPHYKQIDVLKYQQVIVKARSDPNCDMQLHNNDATKYGLSNMINAGIFQNSRMSSSMSAMQQSTDDINISSQNRVNGLDKSSLDSIENSSSKASDREVIKDSRSCNTPRSGSTDSLARNSLLAAKVLRLIPTQKARERNYLHGRLASNSLLGAAELERVFPNREVEIYVGTWNMNGQMPPSELNDFLFPSNVKHVPDILAIGTQESTPERTEWEISIQEALGPSHLLFHSTTLGTLHLCIFLRRDLIWFCSLPEDSSISVRPGTAFRTKGAVAISFALFGTTFMFVTAHLTAHQEKVKERVHDIKRIIKSLDLPKNLPLKHKKNKDVTCNFDVVIWCGDLNFRLSENRAAVLRDLANTVRDGRFNSLNNSSPVSPSLLQADQLAAVLAGETILKGFQEAPIRFPPTYKYDPGTQIFDTSSKQRAPAYTDRILYKTRNNSSATSSSIPGLRRSSSVQSSEPISIVNCLAYDSVPTICSSDHKPVWALFTASLRPGTDIIPLAAGLFNREVYLEGIKRRAAMLDHPPGTSAVCSIQ